MENYDEIEYLLSELQETTKKNKPNDRSERDRYMAIFLTDLEKLVAFYDRYCK